MAVATQDTIVVDVFNCCARWNEKWGLKGQLCLYEDEGWNGACVKREATGTRKEESDIQKWGEAVLVGWKKTAECVLSTIQGEKTPATRSGDGFSMVPETGV